jgi:hypothetical protein
MTASGEALNSTEDPLPLSPPAPKQPVTFAFEAVVLAVLAIPLGVAIAALAWRSTLKIPINYNEGFNAYFVSAVLAGGPLYFPPAALLTDNYPPLSFYLLAPLTSLIGDAVFAGRLVAWLAFAAVAALIVAIPYRPASAEAKLLRLRAGRRNRGLLACLFGGAIFAAYMVTNYDIYVGMDDPQMLAHAIMLLGLFFIVGPHDGKTWPAIAAAVLMGAALFVKHNVVALPLALAAWLAIHDRRAAVRFVAAGMLTAGVGLACCLFAFGPEFLTSLGAPRQYLPVRGWRHAVEWLFPMQLPILLAVLGAVIDRENRTTMLFAGYLLIAVVLACLFAGGAGVNFNLMFDVVIAFSLAAGQLIARLHRQRSLRGWVIGGYAFAALINAGLVGTKDELLLRPWIAAQRAREAATEATVRLLAEHPGPVLCETPILCYWAHKPLELDSFNFGQGVIAGIKDERIVLERIAAGYYSALQFAGNDQEQSGTAFLGPRLRAAAAARYRKLPAAPGADIVYVNPAVAAAGSDTHE